MNFFGKAEEAAAEILRAFQNPNSLPAPLAQLFIKRQDSVPCRSWSWRNQLLVALHGFSDARGFKQWQEMSRSVKRGQKAFFILAPVTKKRVDAETGEERQVIVGFRGVPVFGMEQTEGKPLPAGDPEAEKWVEALPLLDVAQRWGLSVETVDGERASFLGVYRRGKSIALGVKNLSTWCHELVHAADDRLGSLTEQGQHWRSETVAELGGAVLLRLLGFDYEADLGGSWGYIQQYAMQEDIDVVEVCGRVLDRTCRAVAPILDAAEAMCQKVTHR